MTQQQQVTTINNSLRDAVIKFLMNGGTYQEGILLGEHMINASKALEEQENRIKELDLIKEKAVEDYKNSIKKIDS